MRVEHLPALLHLLSQGVGQAWAKLAMVIGVVVIYLLGIFGYAVFKRRKARWPFPNETKILRAPGESLRIHLEKRIEDMPAWVLTGIGIVVAGPTIALLLCVAVAALFDPAAVQYWVLAMAAGSIIGLIAGGWLVGSKMVQYWDLHLGYLGERFVGDQLAQLERSGCRVFHDLACPYGNIDHVVVGPTGVGVIETKTRRKRRDKENAHKVRFDGQNLIWPQWGIRNKALNQVEGNAQWLAKEIKKRAGIAVNPTAIVTIPGWYVDYSEAQKRGAACRPARVVPTDSLANFMEGGRNVLDQEAVRGIALLLEERCRDVVL